MFFRSRCFPSRSRRTWSTLAAITLATLLAACGSNDASETLTSAPETESTTTVAPVTNTPVTTDAAPTTTETPATPTAEVEPDETAQPDSPAPDFESGNWLSVRRITENRGYFMGTVVAEALRYELTCVDEECATIEGRFGPIATSDSDLAATTFRWDGQTWTYGDPVLMLPCLSTSSGGFDGPETTRSTAELVAHPSPAFPESVLEGTFTVDYINPGSPECEPDEVGYDAYVYIFDATKVTTIEAPEAVFSGESTEVGVEHALRPCTPTEGCDVMVREPLWWPWLAKHVAIDIPLTRQPDGTYEGSTTFIDGCLSDLDQSTVTDQGYRATHSIRVNVVDVGEPLMLSQTKFTGIPLATLSPEQAAVCAPFEYELPFAGLITETPELIDWSEPAVVPVEN